MASAVAASSSFDAIHVPAPSGAAVGGSHGESSWREFLSNPAAVSGWCFPALKPTQNGGFASYIRKSEEGRGKPTYIFDTMRAAFDCRLAGRYIKNGEEVVTNPDNKTKYELFLAVESPEVENALESFDQQTNDLYNMKKDGWFAKSKQAKVLNSSIKASDALNPDGTPKYASKMKISCLWMPTKNEGCPFRFAGCFDEKAGSFDNRSPAYVGEDGSITLTPDARSWKETEFVQNAGTIEAPILYDRVPVLGPTGSPIRCSRTGRILYRYIGPDDLQRDYLVTPTVEMDSMWFNNASYGIKMHGKKVIFTPVKREVRDVASTVAPPSAAIEAAKALQSIGGASSFMSSTFGSVAPAPAASSPAPGPVTLAGIPDLEDEDVPEMSQ